MKLFLRVWSLLIFVSIQAYAQDTSKFYINSVNYKLDDSNVWENCSMNRWFNTPGCYDITYIKREDINRQVNHLYVHILNCSEEESLVMRFFDENTSGSLDHRLTTIKNNPITSELSLKIIPNPSNRIVTITIGGADNGYTDAIGAIKDATGRLVMSNIKVNPRGHNVDISHFESGIYYVEVKINDRVYYEKLIKL